MTKEEQEFNELCADFLGWEYIDKDLHPQAYENYGWWIKGTYTNNINARNNSNWKGFDSDLKFHSDWNLIMEVVEAIEKSNKYKVIIGCNDWVKISTQFLHISTDFVDIVHLCSSTTKKEAVVQAIHKFLIYYNNSLTFGKKIK